MKGQDIPNRYRLEVVRTVDKCGWSVQLYREDLEEQLECPLLIHEWFMPLQFIERVNASWEQAVREASENKAALPEAVSASSQPGVQQ